MYNYVYLCCVGSRRSCAIGSDYEIFKKRFLQEGSPAQIPIENFDWVRDLSICKETNIAKIERPTQRLEEYPQKRPAKDPKRRQMNTQSKPLTKDAAKWNAAKLDRAKKQRQKIYDTRLIHSTKEAVDQAEKEENIRKNEKQSEEDRIKKIREKDKRKKENQKQKQENEAKRQRSDAEKDQKDQKAADEQKHAKEAEDAENMAENERQVDKTKKSIIRQAKSKREKNERETNQRNLDKLDTQINEQKAKLSQLKLDIDGNLEENVNKARDALKTVEINLKKLEKARKSVNKKINNYDNAHKKSTIKKNDLDNLEQQENENDLSEALTDDGVHDTNGINQKSKMECKCDDKDACDSNCCKDESDKLTIKTPDSSKKPIDLNKDESDKLTIKTPDSSKKPIDLNKRPEIVLNVLTINQPLSKTASLEAIRNYPVALNNYIDHEDYDEVISSSIQTAKESFLNMTSDMNLSELLRGLQ